MVCWSFLPFLAILSFQDLFCVLVSFWHSGPLCVNGSSSNVDFGGRAECGALVYILLSFSHVLSSVQVLVVSESSTSSALLFGGQTPNLVVVPF